MQKIIFFLKHLFISLAAPGLSCQHSGSLSRHAGSFYSCGMWDLVPRPGIKPGPPPPRIGSAESQPLDHQGSPQKINIFCLLHKEGGVCQLFANISISTWLLPGGPFTSGSRSAQHKPPNTPGPTSHSRPPMDDH